MRSVALCGLVLSMLAAGAAALPPASAPPPASPGKATVKTPPKPDTPVMDLLKRTMMGEPVVAVDDAGPFGWRHNIKEVPTEAARQGDTLLHRLQAVAEVLSPSTYLPALQPPLIPFAVRGVWALAPETREDVSPNLAALTPSPPQTVASCWTKCCKVSMKTRQKPSAPNQA